MGEAHNGLVLNGMACDRVPRWASYVGTVCKRSEWDIALMWDGYMWGSYERELSSLIPLVVLWIVRYYGVECIPAVCRVFVRVCIAELKVELPRTVIE